MQKRESKLIKNTAILGFGTLCTKGLMFIMTPLLTRWMLQSSYGTFDLLTTYVTLLIPFTTLCIGEAAFRFLAEKEIKENKDVNKIVSSSFFIAILGYIISNLLVLIVFILNKSLRDIIPYFLILLLFESINNYFVYILRGLKKLPIYAISNIAFSVTISIFSIIFVYIMKMDLFGIICAYSLGYLVSSLIALIFIRKSIRISIKNIDLKIIKKMLKYSIPLMPNSISWWIVNVSDRTIVSIFLGTSINAVYAVANKIPNLCQIFFNIFNLSWQESAIESMNDEDKNKYFSTVFNNIIKIISSICVLLLACDFLFYKYLFSKSYFLGYYQVPILVLSLVFSTLSQFMGGIYNARMETKKNGLTVVISAIINLIVHISLIKYIGLYAATVSTLISYVSLYIIRYMDIGKKIGLKYEKKSYLYILILLYFFGIIYLNNNIINIINLFLAILFFIIINGNTILKLINKKILKKGK